MEQDIATLWNHSLNSGGAFSLQKKLHSDIRGGILEGALGHGTRLPSTRALAKRLGIARNTVIEAYDQLIAEGYLETRPGAGTFVCAHSPDDLIALRRERIEAPHAPGGTDHVQLSGMPALDHFPGKEWARTTGKAIRGLDTSLMYHHDPMGYAPLRHNIARYLEASRMVTCSYKQVIILSGLQQGLFLLVMASLAQDDCIILEDPGFAGLHAAATASGRRVVYTHIDDNGAYPPEGEKGLLVTSPSQQYPLGHTMPHSRRLELLQWAQASGSLIVEDDYDSEFRYAGRPLNSLQGVDGGKHVIYGGTFSKSLFPAMRMGYMVLPNRLVERVQNLRAAIDSFPPITSQIALHAFMESGEFARHIRRLRKVHAQRHKLCTNHIRDRLSPYFNLQPSDAGLHLLLRPTPKLLASACDEDRWVAAANAAGIGAVTLSHTYYNAAAQKGVLMGFANLEDSQISKKIDTFQKNMAQETGY